MVRFVKVDLFFFVSDQEFGGRAALEWANDFQFPRNIGFRDKSDFNLLGDI